LTKLHLIAKTLGVDRQVPRKPRFVGEVKGHNWNEISFPGSPGLWPGSFKLGVDE